MTSCSVCTLAAFVSLFGAQAPDEDMVLPVLTWDSRLAKKITLDKPKATVAEVLKAISDQRKVDLIAQGDFLGRTVTVLVNGRTARAVMTDIALANTATWMKRGKGYVLVDPNVIGFLQGVPAPVEARRRQLAFVRLLSAHQREYLKTNGRLQYEQLTDPQQTQWKGVLAYEWYQYPDRHPSSILTARSTELRWAVDPRRGAMILLCAPVTFDNGRVEVAPFHEVLLSDLAGP